MWTSVGHRRHIYWVTIVARSYWRDKGLSTAAAHAPLLHGFGVRYDLPISLALYLYAAAGVVVVSFVMVAVFAGDRVGARAIRYPRIEVGWLTRLGRSPAPRAIGGALGVLGLAAIGLTGVAGS